MPSFFIANEKTSQISLKAVSVYLAEIAKNKGKLTIEFDKFENLFNTLLTLIKTKSYKDVQVDEFTVCFVTLNQILMGLYYGGGASKKKIIVIYDILKMIPDDSKLVKDSTLKGFKDRVLAGLEENLFAELEKNLIERDSKSSKLKIENLCKMVEDFLKLLVSFKKNDNIKSFYERLLKDKFFRDSMAYSEVWKVLYVSMKSTIIQFDSKAIFKIQDGNGNLRADFYWLCLDMLSVVNSSSLFLTYNEKK